MQSFLDGSSRVSRCRAWASRGWRSPDRRGRPSCPSWASPRCSSSPRSTTTITRPATSPRASCATGCCRWPGWWGHHRRAGRGPIDRLFSSVATGGGAGLRPARRRPLDHRQGSRPHLIRRETRGAVSPSRLSFPRGCRPDRARPHANRSRPRPTTAAGRSGGSRCRRTRSRRPGSIEECR